MGFPRPCMGTSLRIFIISTAVVEISSQVVAKCIALLLLLQALREIAKAARVEGGAMLSEASAVAFRFKSTLEGFLDLETEAGQQEVENMITEVQDTEQRRTSVASLATSCLHASAPLLASQDSHTCLLVLDTIEVRSKYCNIVEGRLLKRC